MLKWIKKMMADKRAYRALMARGKALPSEYRFVFHKAQDYMWMHSDSEGSGMLQTMQALVELFEESAAAGRNVLDVTGEDVVGFCDEFIRDTRKWEDHYRDKLNRDIRNQFGKGGEGK